MQAHAAAGKKSAAAVNGRQRHGARHNAAQWVKIVAAQRRSVLTVVAQVAQRFLAVPLVAPAAEQIEVDLGTIRVRLAGVAAARVVDAIVARVGRGAQR